MTAQIDRLTTALADRYAVERELGEGGMSPVYVATDLKHDCESRCGPSRWRSDAWGRSGIRCEGIRGSWNW